MFKSFTKVREASQRCKKVQEDFLKIKKVKEGSRRFKKRSRRFNDFKKVKILWKPWCYLLKSLEIQWNPMKALEIPWYFLKTLEFHWNPLKFLEIPRITLNNTKILEMLISDIPKSEVLWNSLNYIDLLRITSIFLPNWITLNYGELPWNT